MKRCRRSFSTLLQSSAALLFLLATGARADPCDPSRCLVCDDSDLCIKCRPGYYLQGIGPDPASGVCLLCPDQCTACLSAFFCTECRSGHARHTADCPRCEKGCQRCDYNSTNCVECVENFTMDHRKNCYYKYTIHIIIAVVLAVCLIIILIQFCIRCIYSSLMRKRPYANVLDKDVKKNKYFIQHISRIGEQEDSAKDLSKVSQADLKGSVTQEGFLNDSTVDLVLGTIIKERETRSLLTLQPND